MPRRALGRRARRQLLRFGGVIVEAGGVDALDLGALDDAALEREVALRV